MPSETVLKLREIKIVPNVLTPKEGRNRHLKRRLKAKAKKDKGVECDICGEKTDIRNMDESGTVLCDSCENKKFGIEPELPIIQE